MALPRTLRQGLQSEHTRAWQLLAGYTRLLGVGEGVGETQEPPASRREELESGSGRGGEANREQRPRRKARTPESVCE
jgi:hypothetical protein